MFKNILISIVLATGLMSYSSFAEDALTIVAVGEAEQEKETIAFVNIKTNGLGNNEKKKLEKMLSLIKLDFNFYKHRYLVSDKKYDNAGQVRGADFVVDGNIEMVGKDAWLNISIQDIKSKKVLHTERLKVWFGNMISFGHNLANNIYRAMTGKESIFKSKILFVSDRTSRRKEILKELYIMDFDGGRKQRLTFEKSLIISPAISPDKKKVVFSKIDTVYKKLKNGGVSKIKNLNLHTLDLVTKRMQVVSAKEGINSGATFNKNGDSIYLTLSFNKNADIYKMNLKTKKLTRVTRHFSSDVDPHINQDGSLLTFLSGRPGKAMIYTLDPKGIEKSVKRISFVGDFNAAPRFNPAGTEIVFSSWVDNRFDIYRIGHDGRNLVRLTKNFGSNEEAWYSPDGEFIVFSSQRVLSRKKAVQDLYIMNRDGEIIKKITENYGKVYTPRWSN